MIQALVFIANMLKVQFDLEYTNDTLEERGILASWKMKHVVVRSLEPNCRFRTQSCVVWIYEPEPIYVCDLCDEVVPFSFLNTVKSTFTDDHCFCHNCLIHVPDLKLSTLSTETFYWDYINEKHEFELQTYIFPSLTPRLTNLTIIYEDLDDEILSTSSESTDNTDSSW